MKLGRRASKKVLRDAIKEMCTQCMGGAKEPGFRQEITNCSAKKCPLYQHRPYMEVTNEAL